MSVCVCAHACVCMRVRAILIYTKHNHFFLSQDCHVHVKPPSFDHVPYSIQWNLTPLGPNETVLITEVSSFQRLIHTTACSDYRGINVLVYMYCVYMYCVYMYYVYMYCVYMYYVYSLVLFWYSKKVLVLVLISSCP